MTESTAANALIESSLVWDNHGCMPVRPHDESFLPQLERYRAAGVNTVALNVGYGEQGIEDHVRMIAHFRRWLMEREDDYVLVGTTDDIERARRQGKLAVMFDIEGMNAVSDQVSLVQLYYDLGVRWMLVAYNRANRAGSGCQEADAAGLTAYGRRLLDEMERVGMVACCSHTGHRTTMDVMAYSKRPVIFSHSNARSVHDHPRNVRDEALRACAATGGVVGINGIGLFLASEGDLVEAFVRHIDYVVQLIGPDHVGLGLDYVFDQKELDDAVSDPTAFPPELGYAAGIQMVPPESIAQIVERLLTLGYSNENIRAILGANLLRVAKQVWRGS
ncbi:MAG: rane dipeptidase [Sphingomonadales bacterium]|nr:rane dipeptidase [Sphingomonadales bacterium]